jgi:hypothetical protein
MIEPVPLIDQDASPAASRGGVASGAAGSGTGAVVGAARRLVPGGADPYGLRALVLSWCIWLLVSWSITLAIGVAVHAVRWVIFSAMVGLMAVWPAVRLSQQMIGRLPGPAVGGVRSRRQACASPAVRVLATMLDWVCLVLVFQVVIWPLMLVGRWSAEQTGWLDAALLSWSLLTALLIGLGRVVPLAGARLFAMLLCMLVLVGEPAWMALWGEGFAGISTGAGLRMRISPLQALWELTTTVRPYDPTPWGPVILSVAVAAGLGWLVLWGMALLNNRDRP